jgi:hypothetical protein
VGRWRAGDGARFDAFNALNRVNYGSPAGNLRSPYFGQPVSAARLGVCASIDFSFECLLANAQTALLSKCPKEPAATSQACDKIVAMLTRRSFVGAAAAH